MNERDRQKFSLHEARHAVTSWVFGFPPKGGWIAPPWFLASRGTVGNIQLDPATPPAVMAVAALVGDSDGGSSWDRTVARKAAEEASKTLPWATAQGLAGAARSLAEQPVFQRLVTALAAEFVIRNKLTGAEIDQILRQAAQEEVEKHGGNGQQRRVARTSSSDGRDRTARPRPVARGASPRRASA